MEKIRGAGDGIIFVLGEFGPQIYTDLGKRTHQLTSLSIPTINRHIAKLCKLGKVQKPLKHKQANAVYDLTEAGREEFKNLQQKEQKTRMRGLQIPKAAYRVQQVIFDWFCSEKAPERAFQQDMFRRSFAELVRIKNPFRADQYPEAEYYAVLGYLALIDLRNCVSPIPLELYASMVNLPREHLDYIKYEFVKRVIGLDPTSQAAWASTPEYIDFLRHLVYMYLNSWYDETIALPRGKPEWEMDAETEKEFWQSLPRIFTSLILGLAAIEQVPDLNRQWLENVVKLLKPRFREFFSDKKEDEFIVSNMVGHLEFIKEQPLAIVGEPPYPVLFRHDSDPFLQKSGSQEVKISSLEIVCYTCGKHYSLTDVQMALEQGPLRCTCEENLTGVARKWLRSLRDNE